MNGRLGYFSRRYRPPNSWALPAVPTTSKLGPMRATPRCLSMAYMIDRLSWPRRVFGGLPGMAADLRLRIERLATKRMAAAA